MIYPDHYTGRDAPLFLMRTWSGSYVEPGRWHRAAIGWWKREPVNVLFIAFMVTIIVVTLGVLVSALVGPQCS